MGITDEDGSVLLSVDEVVEFLQLSRATVYRLIHKGALERRKRPRDRMTYVPLESLESYKAAQGLSLEELAVRLVQLEREVRFLKHQSPQLVPVPQGVAVPAAPGRAKGVSLDGVMKTLRKHHPNVFS